MTGHSGEPVVRLVRRGHEVDLLQALGNGDDLTREELAERLSLSRTTITAIVRDLMDRGAVSPAPTHRTGGRGRPTTALRLNPSAVSALGVELGRGHLSVALMDFRRTVLAHRTVPVAKDPRTHWPSVRAAIEDTVAGHDLLLGAAFGVGFGVYGDHPDPRNGTRPVAARTLATAADALALPITWDNNLRLAALAEARAGSPRRHDLAYVVLSHGVSTGLVVDGHLVRGDSGVAGEIGHLVVDPRGPECECGARGCLTTYLALENFLDRARHAAPGASTLGDLLDLLESGNRRALRFVADTGRMLGRAVSALTMTLDPQEVVIGGELAQLGEHLLRTARELQGRQTPGLRSRVATLRTAHIPQGAAAVGAAHLVLDGALEAAGR